jgi:hypothetical protein
VSEVARLRELAASRGYRLVQGRGRVVGKRDYGRYGLEDAQSGRKVMGFGNRGVGASLAEVEHFLDGHAGEQRDAGLKHRKRSGRRPGR